MASQPTAASKSSSRWGSFLANVESRLDTILADEETAGKAAAARGDGAKVQEQPAKKESMALPAPASGSSSRTPSSNRAQDRLNERLARAMASKNIGKKVGEASQTGSEVPSRTASPVNGVAVSPRESTELPREKTIDQPDVTQRPDGPSAAEPAAFDGTKVETAMVQSEARGVAESLSPVTAVQTPTIAIEQAYDTGEASRASMDSKGSVSTRPSLEITRGTTPNGPDSPAINDPATLAIGGSEEQEKIIEQLRSDNEAAELRRQEETHEYLERIDALQAKLQYLTKEAAEIAKNAASEAKPGSVEHKLAKKDEQVAQLMEEGQKLSQTELKHMTIIKKLRAKAGEDERSVADAKKAAEKHQRLAREASEKARKAEMAERLASERAKNVLKLEKDLENVKAERDANDALVKDLQIQLSEVTSAAKEAEEKANAEELERERLRVSDLTDELSSLKVEKELSEKVLQNEIRELREKAEREKERQRAAEIERKAEQDTLESRLETYRARAEEASAGQGGDVHAKLLRQVETLQNQYAVASENWQGIEGSLLSRVTALEKERDDTAKREADVRRKARETNTKCRRLEEEIERQTSKSHDQDHELSSRSTQLSQLHDKVSKAEAEITAARNDFKAERESWKAQQATRLEEERIRVREELLRCPPDGLYQHSSRTESPVNVNTTRKSSIAENSRGSPALSRPRPSGLAIAGIGIPPLDRPMSRRSSDKRVVTNSSSVSDFTPIYPPPRIDSMNTIPQFSIHQGIPETPTIDDSKQDDDGFFDDITTPATPDRGTINDLISVSTAGAGPSVQLVERMSAAVRRLESEKAAHKDELARLGQQRDEAREQVVEMMKDVEGKGRKDLEAQLKSAEKELGEVKERYLTTLEMLGEKSERVEELKADIVDLKEMYKELVERTTR